jgi:Uma2 family endonuclease
MLDFADLAPEAPRLITREEFEKLGRTDLFSDDERVELLRGVVVRVMPPLPGPGHDFVIQELCRLLIPALGERARVRANLAFAAGSDSQTLPDLAVVPLADYRHSRPEAALLLVEAALSSLRKDRKIKAPIYAEGGVPEYWIVDVKGRCVEVHRRPAAGSYADVRRHGPGEKVSLVAFPDVTIAVNEMLP